MKASSYFPAKVKKQLNKFYSLTYHAASDFNRAKARSG